jgi:hypothetical protein
LKTSKLLLITVSITLCLSNLAIGEQAKPDATAKPAGAVPANVSKEYKEAQQGDVQIHLNGGKDQAILGATNTLEIWIANGAELSGMSLAFEIRSVAAFRWLQPYGERPIINPFIKEEGDAAGAFDFGGLNVKRAAASSATVDSFLIGGAAQAIKLPKHKRPTLCYSLQFRIPASEKPVPGGFCVDNIFFPPAGSWTLHDGSGFPPTYQGRPNSHPTKPDAPAVCFDIVKPVPKQ